MALALATLPNADRFFLGVENSATGRAWRDRLNERGSAVAAAIAQRHGPGSSQAVASSSMKSRPFSTRAFGV